MDSSTRHSFLIVILLGISCAHKKDHSFERLNPEDWAEASSKLLADQIPVERLNQTGPFAVTIHKDFVIPISPINRVDTDLYLSSHESQRPLVIFVHGNHFSKLVHKKQAFQIASWGFHCLALNLPNQSKWVQNGRTIRRLSELIHLFPEIIDDKISPQGIILIGHSFGGSAVSIATGLGAPVKGLILLDPAVVAKSVTRHLKKISIPSVILGADRERFRSRKRSSFFKYLSGPKISVDIVGATHNDAQMPSIMELKWGFDFSTSATKQHAFLKNILVALFSISASSGLEFAWNHYKSDISKGRLKRGKSHLR